MTRSRSRMTLALLALVALGSLGPPPPAHAASFTVTSTLDRPDLNPGNGVCAAQGGACTLRAAIMEANALAGADTITLPADTFILTIAGVAEDAAATDDLDIAGSVTIQGAGAAATIIQANIISRVFDIIHGTVTIADVTVRYGNVPSNAQATGSGIRNQGTLTLRNSTVSGNQSTIGGGISNFATLSVIDSTVSGNQSATRGGGIYNQGTLTLLNSTVSGNRSGSVGGGIHNVGTLALHNSTVANNSVESTGDSGSTGGLSTHDNAMTSLNHTLVANNLGPNDAASDCAGPLTSNGYNLIEAPVGCTITGMTTGNILNKDPRLGPLQDNGGPTHTHELRRQVGQIFPLISPAIDAGDPQGCKDIQGTLLTTDQRGVARPQGARCDIGAFEREVAAPSPTTTHVYLPMIVK